MTDLEAGTRAKRAGLRLLPRGRAWAKDLGGELERFMQAVAEEFHRVERRAVDLLAEFAPDRALELLPRWEAITNTSRLSRAADTATRRAAAAARLARPTDNSLAALVADAAALGYAIEVTAHPLFQAGISVAGDPVPSVAWAFLLDVTATRGATDAALRELLFDRLHAHETLRITWVEPGA